MGSVRKQKSLRDVRRSFEAGPVTKRWDKAHAKKINQ